MRKIIGKFDVFYWTGANKKEIYLKTLVQLSNTKFYPCLLSGYDDKPCSQALAYNALMHRILKQ